MKKLLQALSIFSILTSCEHEDETCKACSDKQLVENITLTNYLFIAPDQLAPVYGEGITYQICEQNLPLDLDSTDILNISASLFQNCDTSLNHYSVAINEYEVLSQSYIDCKTWTSGQEAIISMNCKIGDVVRERYTHSANNLSALHLINTNQLIDSTTSENFLHVFAALAQNDDFESISHYNIESHIALNEGPILLRLDTAYEWTKNFLSGVSPTGESTFDSLINLTQLTIDMDSISKDILLDSSSFVVNKIFLGELLSDIPGVLESRNLGMVCGSRNGILFESYSDSLLMTFTLAYGNCTFDCPFEKSWSFVLKEDCSVTLVHECGTMHPTPEETWQ